METPECAHRQFPAGLAFLLNNPLRRRLNPPHRLVHLLGIGPSDVVVDFGCGPGFYTVELARRAAKTIGVDVSPAMLAKARRAAQNAGLQVTLLQSDGERIELPSESVDLVLLTHVFHEIEQKERALGEFRRILKQGGRVAILERTRVRGLGRLLPGPPVVKLAEITEPAARAGLVPGNIQAFGNDTLVFLTKTA